MEKILTDNWALDAIRQLFEKGLSNEEIYDLIIDEKTNSYSWNSLPFSGIQLEVLISLLVELVLSEKLLVASGYESSRNILPLLKLEAEGIIEPVNINWKDVDLLKKREYLLDQFCRVPALKEVIEKNNEAYMRGEECYHPYLNIIIWGTAGYLIRSDEFHAPYTGHPIRRRLIEKTRLLSPVYNAMEFYSQWLCKNRLHIYDNLSDFYQGVRLITLLPPIAIEIIESSKDADDLIPTALQMRDKYKSLRKWLSKLQNYIEVGDLNKLQSEREFLDSISNYLNKSSKESGFGTVYLNIGIGQIPIPVPDLKLRKHFGVRAILNGQVFSKTGHSSIQRLVSMFDRKQSRCGKLALDYLNNKFASS